MIQFENVSKEFTGRPVLADLVRTALGAGSRPVAALSDVSFTLPAGRCLGVLGGNGSGKSTLLRLAAGLLQPTGGRITTGGRVATVLELGAGFDPRYTGRENLVLAGTLLGLVPREVHSRMDRILEFAGIGGHIDRPVREYSAGTFIRLAFSLATSIDAQVLVLDEVLAAADQSFRRRCDERLDRLLGGGGTLLVVSHDLRMLSHRCDQLLLLKAGRVQAQGAPAEVLRQYFDDVGSGERPAGAGASPILDVALTGKEPGEPLCIRSGNALRIRIRHRFQGMPAGSRLELLVSREDWTVCILADSRPHLPGFPPEAPGVIDVTLDPVLLDPGSYFVGYTLSDATDRILDFQAGAAAFRVAGAPKRVGIFEPHQTWTSLPDPG